MPKRTIRRSSPATDLDADVSEYLLNRSTRERAAYHEGKLKAQFMDLLEESGEAQEGGHQILKLSEPLLFSSYGSTGKITEKDVVGIRRVRRESLSLDADKVMALLEAKKMLDECTEQVRVVNEDAVLAANFEGRITDAEMETLWKKSENFAFYLVEE